MVKSIFNSEQVDFIKDNYQTFTYTEMEQMDLFAGIDKKQLRNKARALGLSKTRKFNVDFFKAIDSEHKAYWLGFLYADGYLVYNTIRRNYEVGVEIHTDDKSMLTSLNSLLGNQHKITSRSRNIEFNGYKYVSKCSRIRIYSKNMCDDLIFHGVETDKTNSIKHPMIEDDILFMHFLRGFMDGDGCIHKKDDKIKQIHFTNSNIEFLEYIKTRLQKMNIKSNIYKEKEKKYRLNISMSDFDKFLNKIYHKSTIRLERKYKLYNSL